jgi:hypothetical protein
VRTVDERHVLNGRLMASEVRVGDGLMLGPHTFRVRTVEPLHIFEWLPPKGTPAAGAALVSYGPSVIKFEGRIEDIDQPRNLIVATDHVFQLEPSHSDSGTAAEKWTPSDDRRTERSDG